jgi:hypothetical protein
VEKMIRISFQRQALAQLLDAVQPEQKIKKVNRTLNSIGFEFRREYNEKIKQSFNLRNNHLISGTGVNKTSIDSPLSRSRVEVGTTRKINLAQEMGGERTPKSGSHYPVAMKNARRGASENSDLKTRSRMDKLQNVKKYQGSGKKAMAAATQQAGRNKNKFFGFDQALWQYANVRKRQGSYQGKLKKLYDLSHETITDPAKPIMNNLSDHYIEQVIPSRIDPIFDQ